MFETTITYSTAFGAGLLSFLTPCVFPLVPVYFTLITGLSLDDLTGVDRAGARKQVFFSTLAFVTGFSTIFILLGASASFLGSLIGEHRLLLKTCGGILIVILGIHLTGIIHIPWLKADKRFRIKGKTTKYIGAFIAGVAFSAGWTPCIGPILGSILIVAGNQATVYQGMLLLTIFSAGLAIPFLLLSVFINVLLEVINRLRRVIKYINPVAGSLLITAGVLLISGI
ncbi:MAG: cytochrome c biogenesis protein CcdA [Thermodesulfobacteriota bacterium]